MINAVESVSSSYPAIAETVRRTRHELAAIAASAGATPDELDRVRLAISEAVTNAVEHAYGDGDGLVHVSAFVSDRRLSVLVADDGCGLGGSCQRKGLGVGLAVAAHMSDGFALAKRSSGGVEVQMQFELGAVGVEHHGLRDGSILGRARIVREVGDALGR